MIKGYTEEGINKSSLNVKHKVSGGIFEFSQPKAKKYAKCCQVKYAMKNGEKKGQTPSQLPFKNKH